MSEQLERSKVETLLHKQEVAKGITAFCQVLMDRALYHDESKLQSPEVEIFGEHTHELSKMVYGSDEYKQSLEKLKPAIEHHYAKNRHHPEFHKNGVDDMTLIDVLEMLADWFAATKRHETGNIRKSLEINTQRYKLSPQLKQILENTVREYFD